MDSAAVLRSFQCSASLVKPLSDRPGIIPVHCASFSNLGKLPVQSLTCSGKLISSAKYGPVLASCVKTPESSVTEKSDDSLQQASSNKNTLSRATFPNGLEALVAEVCDETEIAELKLKIGDFEMHLKRSIESPKSPNPVASTTTAPPAPSEPVSEPVPAASVPSENSPTEKISPFTNVSWEKSVKLAALEASVSTKAYVIVPCKTVGTFRRGRTGRKKLPPVCKEGDNIKVGQVIGYVDQFKKEHAIISDVDGEVLKFLYEDGEAIGYDDPLVAVLPSFHDIGYQ